MKELFKWSYGTYHHLPWRKNRSLYGTLVSEIMLQQTTVSTVLNHFEKFLIQFPDLQTLARASEEQIAIAWKGLGYYRRARHLHKACQYIVNELRGEIPLDFEHLVEIPGIGPYTANALIAIGSDQRALAIDANIERVVSRMFSLSEMKGSKLQKEIELLFQSKKIFSRKPSIGWRGLNESLMDLGRVYCQARKAHCQMCPAKSECLVFTKKSDPLAFPVQSDVKKQAFHDLKLLRLVVRNRQKLLVCQRGEGKWLSGQFEVPTFILSSSDKGLSQYPFVSVKELQKHVSFPKTVFKSSITKYKIENHVVEINQETFKELKKLFKFTDKTQWLDEPIEKQNITTATLKSIKALK